MEAGPSVLCADSYSDPFGQQARWKMADKNEAPLTSGMKTGLAAFPLGVAVGLMVGLSTSPIVSSVVGSLSAIALAFLKKSDAQRSNGHRLGTIDPYWVSWLAVGFVIAMLAGVWCRTHNVLGESVSARAEKWRAIGIPDDLIHASVIYQEVGLIPPDWQRPDGGSDKPPTLPTSVGVLFGADDTEVPWALLRPKGLSDLEAVLGTWEEAGGRVQAVAQAVREMREPDERKKKELLQKIWELGE